MFLIVKLVYAHFRDAEVQAVVQTSCLMLLLLELGRLMPFVFFSEIELRCENILGSV